MVPDSFPGVLALQEVQENTGQDLLHEDYGRFHQLDARKRPEEDWFKSDFPEYEYFITHLLSRVRPSKTKFKKLKENKMVSECFTPSDEAFALIVLDNELHVWDAQVEKKGKGTTEKQKGSSLRIEKKYTDGNSGKKIATCGWKIVGLKKYNSLVAEIRKKREMYWEDEKKYREMFMWRAHPEKEKDFKEGRQEHQNEDSESEIEWDGMERLERFELQNTMISGHPNVI